MIEVYGRRNSVNVQKVMWTLGELALGYDRRDVGGGFDFPDDYRQLNPNGAVPTIVDGDLVLWESNVCVRYLARSYGAGTLWPEDPATLARADQWMDWQQTQLLKPFFQVFLNLIRKPPERTDHAEVAAGVEGCGRLFEQLDTVLGGRPFLAGDTLTMGDIPIGAVAYRYFNLQIERPLLPNLAAWYERLAARPAYQYHVMIPFGANQREWQELETASAGVQ